jgi:hypothetical protein
MPEEAKAEVKVCTYEVVRPFWDGKQKILPRQGANSRVRLPEGTEPRGAILIKDETPEPAPNTAQEPAKEPDQEPSKEPAKEPAKAPDAPVGQPTPGTAATTKK